MADKFLWDQESPTPTSDVENPPVSVNNNAVPESRPEGSRCSTSKAVKLGLGLTAVAGVVALGVIFGLYGSTDDPVAMQTASSASSVTNKASQGADESKPSTVKSANGFSISSGAQAKMTSTSITHGYETCNDLEKDITDALKLYMSDFIANEALMNEVYASCDPDNENWWSDIYGYDDYVYHDHGEYTYILLVTHLAIITHPNLLILFRRC
jgi:DNA excision repair protein ERCC-4